MLNSNSKLNAISSGYAQKLVFKVWKINIRAQKIDGSILKTYKMVIADFQVKDKVDRPKCFQKTFLIADTKFEVILKIFFLKMSNANMSFGEELLMWKSYSTNEALLTIEQI